MSSDYDEWNMISLRDIAKMVGGNAFCARCRIIDGLGTGTSTIVLPNGVSLEVPHKRCRTASDNKALFVRIKLMAST